MTNPPRPPADESEAEREDVPPPTGWSGTDVYRRLRDARAENERLTADRDRRIQELEQLTAEVRRLREELNDWLVRVRNEAAWRVRAETEVFNLRAELAQIEREAAASVREQPCDACETMHVPCDICPCVQYVREAPAPGRDTDGAVSQLEAEIGLYRNLFILECCFESSCTLDHAKRTAECIQELREEAQHWKAVAAIEADERLVEVGLITGAELQQLGCCCASPDWTDVTKGCTDAWLKENGY